MHVPDELWSEVRQYLGVSDILATARVCRGWRRHANDACVERWPLAPPAWDVEIREIWRRILDPRPCCLICGDATRPTSVVVMCTCLRRAAGAVTLIRFHYDCWDFQCFRPECSVILLSCPLCHATRVGWRRFLLE